MSSAFRIGPRSIGPGQPCFLVAELSANHLGDLERAKDIVRASAEAGADAMKLQTYTPDTITLDCEGETFRIGPGTPWAGRGLHEIYGEAMTPWEWHAELFDLSRELGMVPFSSPFDPSAVAFLESLDVPAHKIASFELVDTGLIEQCARTGKPLIMSTGMSTREEIETALQAARGAGATDICLLKCTSAYPSPTDALDLRTIPALAREFGVLVGLSDHTLSPEVVIAAVTLGACVVERHVTLKRSDGGPDGGFSMEPDEFAHMVKSVRLTETALGRERFEPTEAERATLAFRRSLFVVEDVKAGERLTERNVRSVRPGNGLPPKHLPQVLGQIAKRDAKRGTPLSWDLVDAAPVGE